MAANAGNTNRQRKEDHIRIVLNEDVRSKGITTGLESHRLVHQALPEINLEQVDTSISLFGKKLHAPIIISSMVGGIESAQKINRSLAQAAQKLGLAMGVGSQRCAVDDESLAATYQVRDIAPDILLFANLGAVQLNYGYGVKECRRAVEMIQANALVMHLNPLQEALQPEGNTNFAGLLRKIAKVCQGLSVPVIVKEVGCGISGTVARELAAAGVACIDTGGAGGTSWSEVEKYRAPTPTASNLAASFAGWGIPTAESIQMARRGAPKATIIASGGIRNGMDIAKAIALGADAAGIAAPLLQPATESAEEVVQSLQGIVAELRIAMFCSGVANIAKLRKTPLVHEATR